MKALGRRVALALMERAKPVHIAREQAEREAIYRFRYRVYVEELKREIGGVDRDRRMVVDEDDEAPSAWHFYIGSAEALEAVLRVRFWEAGQMPPDMREALSTERFGPAFERFAATEVGRLMVDPTARGRLLVPVLINFAYRYMVTDKGAALAFLYCRPGLVAVYRRLGLRTYGGRLVNGPEGIEVPMLAIASDVRHLRSVGSPEAHIGAQLFGAGRRPPVDLAPFLPHFAPERQNVIVDAAAIERELLGQRPVDGRERAGLLDGIGPEGIRLLARNGTILEIPEGLLLIREGHAEREVFLVLRGSLEVVRGGRAIAQVGAGDVLGEMAFFREDGLRSASARALEASRVLVLRRRFLDDLAKKNPRAAHRLLFSFGRALSDRVASGNAQIVT